MAQSIQFEQFQPGEHPECQAAEALLADALDQALSPADQAWFEAHLAVCEHCSALFADAQRGAAWLEMLKAPRPEPSGNLLHKILAATTNQAPAEWPLVEDLPCAYPVPAYPIPVEPIPLRILPEQPQKAPLLPFRPRPQIVPASLPRFAHSAFEPRLAMTAAMAFFSIALTLNLTGIRLDQMRVADLKPSALKRSFYEVKGDAARRYDSLRMVHVLESRVEDLKAAGVGLNVSPGDGGEEQLSPAAPSPDADPHTGNQQDRQPDGKEPHKPQTQTSGQPQASTHRNSGEPRRSERAAWFESVGSLKPAGAPSPEQKRGRA